MRLILHQALKDLRAQRWLALAWLATLLAAGAVEASKLDVHLLARASVKRYVVPPAAALISLAVARAVLGWLLAIRIVQADPLDDTGAFWLTRPISRGRLMASKLGLLACLFFLLPGVVAGVVFLANNVAPGRIPLAVVEWCLFDAVLLLPLVLLATLTRDRARIGLALIVGATAWFYQVGVSALVHRQLEWIWNDWQPVYRAIALTLSGYGFAIVALSAGLIVWQYRTRRPAFTGWLAMGTVVALAAAAVLPQVRFSSSAERPAPVVDNRWAGARDVSIELPASSIAISPFSDRTIYLAGTPVTTGSDGVLIDVAGGSGTLRVDGTAKPTDQRDVRHFNFDFLVRLALGTDANRRVFGRAIGARLVGASRASWNALTLAQIRREDYSAIQDAHARYDADLRLAAYHLNVSPPVPLRVGAATGVGLIGATLLGAGPERRDPHCWSAEIRESDARTLLPPSSTLLGFVLRNRMRGEAVPLLAGLNSYAIAQGLGSTFLTVSEPGAVYCAGVGMPKLDSAWLADADLLMLTIERLGTFERHVEVKDFVMPTAVGNGERR